MPWLEFNCTDLKLPSNVSVPVFEPCNFASNLAWYNLAVEICYEDWLIPKEDGKTAIRIECKHDTSLANLR